MKNKTNLIASVLTLFWIPLNSSCASSRLHSIPELENRTLRIAKDFAGFEYQFETCLSEFVGICLKKEMKKDVYDLNDPAVRQKLIDMGFVARVKEKL